MSYNFLTITEFDNLLAQKLGDIKKVFWTDNHIRAVRIETLLTFGATSQYWRTKGFINTEVNKIYYDITTDLIQVELRDCTITYADIIKWLELDLMEDFSSEISGSFPRSILLTLIRDIVNSYLFHTSIISRYKDLGQAIAGSQFKELDNNIIDVKRLSFIYDDNGIIKNVLLNKEDEDNLNSFNKAAFTSEGIPSYYTSILSESIKTLRFYKTPSITGDLHGIVIEGNVDLVEDTTLIGIPNNLAPYIKYGAEAYLFNQDFKLRDSNRKVYCNKRWQEGLLVGGNYPSILNVELNGRIINIGSLKDLDLNYNWEVRTGQPRSVGIASYNLFAVNKKPDDIYSLSLDLVKPAPISSGFIDIKAEYVETLLEYAYFLAMLKCGIYEVQSNIEGYNKLMKLASIHNSRLTKLGISHPLIIDRSSKQIKQSPTYDKELLSVGN